MSFEPSLSPECSAAMMPTFNFFFDTYRSKPLSDLSIEEIEKLISDRNDARENKKFDLADKIRNQLAKKGIVLEDLDGKTIWKKS